jgi:S-(hydroxymethyl)glutathione dehydrogenase / alcohol dehydrogenase
MKAAVLREVGTPLRIEDVQIDKPRSREVLIRTAVAGICHSDLHFIEGHYPHPLPAVLGHESAGTVEAVGTDVTYVQVGDHVTACQYNCGHCRMCLTGHPHWCDQRGGGQRSREAAPRLTSAAGETVHGFADLATFAELMLVHEDSVVKLPEGMPLDAASLVSCGVMTGFGAVVNTAQVRPGASVAVIGCGGIGLNAVQAAYFSGAARVIAVDKLPSKLELAKRFGATDVVDASQTDPVATVHELVPGGVDHAFEAIGLPGTAEQAWRMLGRRGTATIIGAFARGQSVTLDTDTIITEKRLQGSFMGSGRYRIDMPFIMDLYLQGRYKLDELISERIGLDDVNDGYEALEHGEVARSVIVFD